MKKLMGITMLYMLPHWAMGAIDETDAETAFQNIVVAQDQNLTNIGYLSTNAEKKTAFSNILTDVLGTLITQQWNHPSGQAWPIVDWNRVDQLDDFFSDQISWIIQDEVVADTAEELAKLQFSGAALAQQSLLAPQWFEEWFSEKVLAPDDNMKRLLFWYADDFSSDLEAEPGAGSRVIDWTLWKQNFNNANDLGKAIILRNLTMLAARNDGWEAATEVHMLVFNGNNDELKAIALVKGHKNLGADVIAKWTDLAANSANQKLKSLAQQAIDKFTVNNDGE